MRTMRFGLSRYLLAGLVAVAFSALSPSKTASQTCARCTWGLFGCTVICVCDTCCCPGG